MSWNELMPQMKYRVRARRPIAESENRVLSQLYLPIIHANAYSLYMFFYHQLSPEHWLSGEFSHQYIMQSLGIDLQQILRARERLEGVGLLAAYQLEDRIGYEYVLQPPLTPAEFFQSDVLNYLLLNQIGQTHYRTLHRRYSIPLEMRLIKDVKKEDVTKTFSQVYAGLKLTEFAPKNESESRQIIAELHKQEPLPEIPSHWKGGSVPDFEVDYDTLMHFFPKAHHPYLFTDKHKHLMKMYAFLYNLNSERLGMLLNDSYNKEEKIWDINRFIELAKRSFRAQSVYTLSEGDRITSGVQDSAETKLARFKTTSPFVLLRDYQSGGQVSKADERLVEDLINKIGLEIEVVNVLLDFVMLMKDNQLPREYTMKVASSWKRRGFQTAEEAFEFALKEYQKKDPKRTYFKSSTRKKVPEYIWLQVERDRAEEKQMEQKQLESSTDFEEVERLIQELNKKR